MILLYILLNLSNILHNLQYLPDNIHNSVFSGTASEFFKDLFSNVLHGKRTDDLCNPQLLHEY
jgi:hypothetical protein